MPYPDAQKCGIMDIFLDSLTSSPLSFYYSYFFEMLGNLRRPCRRYARTFGKRGDHRTECLKVRAHARRVTGERGGILGGDADVSCDLHRIDVRTEEDERPALLLFLLMYQRPHSVRRPVVLVRGLDLRVVRDDDEHRTHRAILGARPPVLLPSHVNAGADGIEQPPSAARAVLLYEIFGMFTSILSRKGKETRKAALFDERGLLGDRHAGIMVNAMGDLFMVDATGDLFPEPNKDIRPLLPEPRDHIVESVDRTQDPPLARSAPTEIPAPSSPRCHPLRDSPSDCPPVPLPLP